MLVTNSVRKDPRVQKEAMTAYNAGHEVTVIGIKDQNYDHSFVDKVPYKVVLIDSIANNHKRFTPAWFLSGVTKAIKYNKRFVEEVEKVNPDLVHSNDFDTLSAGYQASKKCNAKLVYDSHEVATGSILAEKYKLVKTYIKFREGRIIRKAYKVISVSNAAADYIANLYHIERPVVITNCPPYYHLSESRSSNHRFEILYQGIMSTGRGYEEFIRAINYSDEKITYVVRGYGEIKDELMLLSKKECVEDRVFFLDPVEISELIPIASTSSVGVVLTKPVCTNYNMTVSNKFFEYIQAGLPVILSNVPEHVFLNNKYSVGIVIDDVSPEKIGEAANMLYRNSELYMELKENVKRAKQDLSWEKIEEKLLEIYSVS